MGRARRQSQGGWGSGPCTRFWWVKKSPRWGEVRQRHRQALPEASVPGEAGYGQERAVRGCVDLKPGGWPPAQIHAFIRSHAWQHLSPAPILQLRSRSSSCPGEQPPHLVSVWPLAFCKSLLQGESSPLRVRPRTPPVHGLFPFRGEAFLSSDTARKLKELGGEPTHCRSRWGRGWGLCDS